MFESMVETAPLAVGDRVLVRYGGFGKQVAVVVRVNMRAHPLADEGTCSFVLVRKYLNNSKRWTKPVRVAKADIISRLEPDHV